MIARACEGQLGVERVRRRSPTTRLRRSSTTSAASARCHSSSTPTSRPAPRTGTRGRSPGRAAGAAGGGRARTRARLGRRRVAVAERAGDARRDRARRQRRWRRPGRRPILGDELADGRRDRAGGLSGLHANGASLARGVAERLPDGYASSSPGQTLRRGAAGARVIYVPLVGALLERAVAAHYLSHITGHGLLKLMRARAAFTYRIASLPPCPPVLELAGGRGRHGRRGGSPDVQHGERLRPLLLRRGWPRDRRAGRAHGSAGVLAGRVEEGPRRVILEPIDVLYEGHELEFSPIARGAAGAGSGRPGTITAWPRGGVRARYGTNIRSTGRGALCEHMFVNGHGRLRVHAPLRADPGGGGTAGARGPAPGDRPSCRGWARGGVLRRGRGFRGGAGDGPGGGVGALSRAQAGARGPARRGKRMGGDPLLPGGDGRGRRAGPRGPGLFRG